MKSEWDPANLIAILLEEIIMLLIVSKSLSLRVSCRIHGPLRLTFLAWCTGHNFWTVDNYAPIVYWQMIELRFKELLDHSLLLLKKKWLFGVLDDFVTKQLPHNVTWGLSLLYAMEHQGDRALTSTQGEINITNLILILILCYSLSHTHFNISGELAHALRFLASVVSQSFLAFGDILELHRKFLELSGSINRIFELEEFLDAAQSGTSFSILRIT